MRPTKKRKSYTIPFDPRNGNMQHWPQAFFTYTLPYDHPDHHKTCIRHDPKLRQPYEFDARMKYLRHGRGRSSLIFWVQDMDADIEYPLFFNNFDEMMKRSVKGEFEGTFETCKMGMSYGINFVDAKEED